MLTIKPKWSKVLSFIQSKPTGQTGQKGTGAQSFTHIYWGSWNSVAFCGPPCIYEWFSLGAKIQNNAATLKGWISLVGGWGGSGGGEGSLFSTVGAWYREWREVLLGATLGMPVTKEGLWKLVQGFLSINTGYSYLLRWGSAALSPICCFSNAFWSFFWRFRFFEGKKQKNIKVRESANLSI